MEDVMNTTHEPASLNPYAGWFFGFWLLALLGSGIIRSGLIYQDTRHQALIHTNNQSVTTSQTKL